MSWPQVRILPAALIFSQRLFVTLQSFLGFSHPISSSENRTELRPGSSGRSELRVLFAFDPERRGILLVAGDKAGNCVAETTWDDGSDCHARPGTGSEAKDTRATAQASGFRARISAGKNRYAKRALSPAEHLQRG